MSEASVVIHARPADARGSLKLSWMQALVGMLVMSRCVCDMARYRMTSRRLGFFLCFIGFVWGIALINTTLQSNGGIRRSEDLKEEILQLSENYVRALALETKDTIDGPYAGKQTGYDLKKTLAVLLENMLDRLGRLEKQVNSVMMNRSFPVQSPQSVADRLADVPSNAMAKDILAGVQETCILSEADNKKFPHCQIKMAWMRAHWKSDPCYAKLGVDGSECSFQVYLSEVESFCPLLPGRVVKNETGSPGVNPKAVFNFDLSGLMVKLQDVGERQNYAWIRARIERMWPNWTAAARHLEKTQNMTGRDQKRILLHLGLLSKKSGFKITESTEKGGPLGELVQWSDILSTLYILGHDVVVTSEVEQLASLINGLPRAYSPCQVRTSIPVDLMFTDIVGLIQFKRKIKNGYGKFSCLLRIIDSFGTEPAFNYMPYAKTHNSKSQWAMHNLNPQQFFTMFPHSPDNSFMGFVVEQHLKQTKNTDIKRKNQAVVYGKALYMWQGKQTYLNIIKDHLEVHGTVFVDKPADNLLPNFVHNHGILKGPELQQLLRESKVFVGLGFPYEGPGPLEAIAQGCVFLNPRFNPPHSSHNVKFFKGKPTRRSVASQHPYAEDFIGMPHVHTINIDNATEVRAAVKKAIAAVDSGEVQPYMPYEFTEEGMLQRVNAYLIRQDFCSQLRSPWVPRDSVEFILSRAGQSCKTACMEKRMICEPLYFGELNSQAVMEKYMGKTCLAITYLEDIFYPAYMATQNQCYLQKQPMLFSCVGERPDIMRLCPCRDFIKGQMALCQRCL
ncbi:Alpha-1,6-mannosylglycoprotein 6-beta-N-acetylglucosaminyltransferase A [Lamellibrachia satsuma]|nr:Alpha-1,6-mannosylglycoprotein 6-beta-N-acetylglucosaminyltransferase A [Lamellibrachia satsuma]